EEGLGKPRKDVFLDADMQRLLAEELHPPFCDHTGEAGEKLPFSPRSFRDFMLYREHALQAARGYAARYLPASGPVVQAYEKLVRRPFPAFLPAARWNEYPIYYQGNHLSLVPSGSAIPIPSFAEGEVDYELELGAVLVRPLRDAHPEEALAAVGAFFVINDFSIRCLQRSEMTSGFGPVKAKSFATAMSVEVVPASEIANRLESLSGEVWINGERRTRCSSAGPHFSFGEAIAYASQGETLYPGEVLATGTWPGGSGLEAGEMLKEGDEVELRIEGVGVVRNQLVS
ncbi:MAG: fumarylacetoacetate hydrolase family protein, partial [Verrucomicrobiota bacterium]